MSHTSEHQYLERADYTWSEDSIRCPNTSAMSVKQLFFYVQEVGYFRTSPLFHGTCRS